jgi:WD40 repeat protein
MNEPYGMLVTAGQDDTVKVWDLCDGEQLGQLRGHKGESHVSAYITDTRLIGRFGQSTPSGRYIMPNRRFGW